MGHLTSCLIELRIGLTFWRIRAFFFILELFYFILYRMLCHQFLCDYMVKVVLVKVLMCSSNIAAIVPLHPPQWHHRDSVHTEGNEEVKSSIIHCSLSFLLLVWPLSLRPVLCGYQCMALNPSVILSQLENVACSTGVLIHWNWNVGWIKIRTLRIKT